VFLTGDAASQDADGYFWFRGRSDEVLKIAGHRIGTSEVESALLKHFAVSEAGVTGLPDELRGEVILAFVVLRPGEDPHEGLVDELKDTVRRELGPVAVIGGIEFVPNLPKTRSGKIMRRLLKSVILGKDTGDISTIEDPAAVDAARDAWQSQLPPKESD
jgi:acetyl-CoA synthetase